MTFDLRHPKHNEFIFESEWTSVRSLGVLPVKLKAKVKVCDLSEVKGHCNLTIFQECMKGFQSN